MNSHEPRIDESTAMEMHVDRIEWNLHLAVRDCVEITEGRQLG